MGGRLFDWLGSGVGTSRPAAAGMGALLVSPGSTALYFATDTKILSIYDESGPSWLDLDTTTITGITNESIQDMLATFLIAGSGISFSYNDAANQLTISCSITQYTDEMAQDTIAALIAAGTHTGITITYDDASNTLSFTNTVTQYTDEMAQDAIGALIAAGTQSGITVTYNDALNKIDYTVPASYTDEQAQDTVAAMFAAGSHTGVTVTYNDAANSISLAATGSYNDEAAMDAIAAMLAAGSHTGITVTYNDAGNSMSLASTVTQYTNEMAMDAIAAMLAAGTHTGITVTYNDAGDSMSLTVTGGGGGGNKWIREFRPLLVESPSTLFAYLDSRNGHPVLTFDPATAWSALWTESMPSDYSGAGVTITLYWALSAGNTGNVMWTVALERIQDGVQDIGSDGFATAQAFAAAAAPGTNGFIAKTTLNISNGANMDSIAAGDLFRIKITRDAANASDTATGNAQLLMATMVSQ
jgi:hypothetical protein